MQHNLSHKVLTITNMQFNPQPPHLTKQMTVVSNQIRLALILFNLTLPYNFRIFTNSSSASQLHLVTKCTITIPCVYTLTTYIHTYIHAYIHTYKIYIKV